MRVRLDSQQGPEVPSPDQAVEQIRAHLAAQQRLWAEQLTRDPAAFALLEPQIHLAFGKLAENAAASLRKGTAVAVTGQLADDSYTPDGWDRPIRRHRLEAADIAVSLRWATATITRARDTNGSNGSGGEPTEPGRQAGTAESTDDRQDG